MRVVSSRLPVIFQARVYNLDLTLDFLYKPGCDNVEERREMWELASLLEQ